MAETNETPKKISMQEAVKRQLEAKKNQAASKQGGSGSLETKKMKSQQTKKVSNNRRKMGT